MIGFGTKPAAIHGFRLHTSEWLPDGDVLVATDGIFVGVRPETDVQHEARVIVRTGLADELRWLGQSVLTGRGVMASLRANAD